MNKLPLEIWEHIVERAIWAPKPFHAKYENWEDGPLRLELAEFHPLRHYLNGGLSKHTVTDAEKTFDALMRTSTVFKRISERFTRELLSAQGILEWRCECGSQESDTSCDDPVPIWGLSIVHGTVGAHAKVLNVADAIPDASDELWYGPWPNPSPADFAPLRQSCGLVALSLGGTTLAWLPPVLDALPGRGAMVEQLKFVYFEREGDLSDAQIERLLAAITRCTSLKVLDAEHEWEWEAPMHSKAPNLALRAALALCHTLSYLRLSGFYGEGAIGGTTPATLARGPLALRITRLALWNTSIDSDAIQRLVEGCSESLEYLTLDEANYFGEETAAEPSSTVARFPRLRHIVIEPPDYSDPNFDASILPSHWEVPAIVHLAISYVFVEGNTGVKTFTDRIRLWKTLRYLRVQGGWSYEDDMGVEIVEGHRFAWVESLELRLHASGVDAELHFASL